MADLYCVLYQLVNAEDPVLQEVTLLRENGMEDSATE